VVFKTFDAQETLRLGEKFSGCLEGGDVVLFEGALGGGKTTFIKGIVRAAGGKERVLSPTFTLARQYKTGTLIFNHVDLYRLDAGRLFDWGLDDYLYDKKVINLIEWGEKIAPELDKYIKVDFEYLKRENARRIAFSLKGYKKNKLNFRGGSH